MAMKYKTWEVIKELTENPNQRFTPVGHTKDFLTSKINEIVWFGDNLGGQKLEVDTSVIWEKVQSPVDFMDAIKAYALGKKIRCELTSELYGAKTKFRYSPDGGDKFCVLLSDDNEGLSQREILEGTWYIEE